MLQKLESFFTTFKDSQISDESLAIKIDEKVEDIIVFCKDYNNYKDSLILENLYIKKEEFDINGQLIQNRHFLNKNIKDVYSTKITFIDRYYVSKKRELDLYFASKLFNIKPEKGQIDDSDCGGLYRSAWTYTTIDGQSHESEIPFFHKENVLDMLFKKLPWLKCSIHYYDNNFHINLSSNFSHHQYVSITLKDLSLGVMESIRLFLEQNKIELFTLIPIENTLFDTLDQTQLVFNEKSAKKLLNDNEESTWFIHDYSIPVFCTKEEAITELNKRHRNEEYKYIIISGS